MSKPTRIKGPFGIDSFGDFCYVVSDGGERIAETSGDDARAKAEQVCAALNVVHYLAEATGASE